MFSKSNACPISGFSASRGTRTATSPLITFLRAKTMPQSAIFPVPRRSRPGFRWCRVPARGNDEPLPPGTLVLTASGGDGEGVPPQAAARTVQILFKALERTGADHPGSVLDGLPRRDGGQNRRRRRAGVGVDVAYPKNVYLVVSSNLPPNPLKLSVQSVSEPLYAPRLPGCRRLREAHGPTWKHMCFTPSTTTSSAPEGFLSHSKISFLPWRVASVTGPAREV